ncbi:MAG: 50S ribosomal protein L28 [Bifidobacteriaceae bacterium]|jgi:large subunit ribosomal protein L28|nr:50S ribosomal protein L28 [Bifidobacteriaceae bacterium]
MASKCEICSKQAVYGNNVSHSHLKTRRRWNPNIQTVHIVVAGSRKKVKACTSCIKAGKVV